MDETISITMLKNWMMTEASESARELFNGLRFGDLKDSGRVQLSFAEALYLLEKGKAIVKEGRGRKINAERIIREAQKHDPQFWVRYCVFKDLRDKGYIVKTALKFGADFRVYDKGVKPGEDHAKWIVFPVHEVNGFTWHDFSGKNRVAHSTHKKLLIGIVDDEGDVTYYEVKWMRP